MYLERSEELGAYNISLCKVPPFDHMNIAYVIVNLMFSLLSLHSGVGNAMSDSTDRFYASCPIMAHISRGQRYVISYKISVFIKMKVLTSFVLQCRAGTCWGGGIFP